MVLPAVEVAEEAHQHRTPGERAREPGRHQVRLGPRGGEAHALGARHHLLHQPCPTHLEFAAGCVVRTEVELFVHRGQHPRFGVPQDQCAVPAVEIDVLVAVHVPFAPAVRAFDVDGVRVQPPAVVHDAAGQDLASGLGQLCRGRRALTIGRHDRRVARAGVTHLFSLLGGHGVDRQRHRRRRAILPQQATPPPARPAL